MKTTIKQLERNCPVCESTQGLVLGELNFALFDDCPLAKRFDVIACNNCHFVFYDTPDNTEKFTLFYKDHYFSSSYFEGVQIASVDAVVNIENNPYAIMKPYITPESKICEIGCGRGALLVKMQSEGFTKLYGVEPSYECVEFIKKHHGIDAMVGTADNIPYGIKFDVIFSAHVLEHVLNLNEVVFSIANRLSQKGLVYIEVPDLEGYASQAGASPLDYITFYEHINHFTISSLHELFNRHGLYMIDHGKKILNKGTRLPLPAVYGIFTKEDPVDINSPPLDEQPFDVETVRTWLAAYRFLNSDKLEELAQTRKPVYIWGINLPTQKLIAMSPLRKCNIAGLLDKDPDKQKKSINGRKIQSPEVLKTVDENAVVVIWGGPYRESIEEDLQELGFRGKIIIL